MAKITRSDGTEIFVPDEQVWPVMSAEDQIEDERRRIPAVKRWQIAGALEAANHITWTEAQAYAGGNALPPQIGGFINNSQYSTAIKKRSALALLGGDEISPRDVEFAVIKDAFGLTKGETVALFKAAFSYDLG